MKTNNYRFGFDIGCASVGWSVVGDKIVELGSNIFSEANPENNKVRRDRRGQRRLMRRRKNRIRDFKVNFWNKYVEPKSDGSYVGGGSSGVWIVENGDKRETYSSKADAIKASGGMSGNVTISVSNGSGTYKWAEGTISGTSQGQKGTLEKKSGGTINVTTEGGNGVIYTEKDENGKTISTNNPPPFVPSPTSDYVYYPPQNNNGGGGGNILQPPQCFVAGTKVLTNKGYKDIDKIIVGDIVLSYNENTKENEYKKVLEVFNHKNVNDNIYSLTINNTVIEASSEHPFYVKADDELKLVEAKDLKIGDIVINSDGNYYPITQIVVNEMMSGNLYNIKVEDNHNYYVSSSNILVHNKR